MDQKITKIVATLLITFPSLLLPTQAAQHYTAKDLRMVKKAMKENNDSLLREQLIKHWNEKLKESPLKNGEFILFTDGLGAKNIIYDSKNSNETTPTFALEPTLISIGFNGYPTGSGGIDPFKYYLHKEYAKSNLGCFFGYDKRFDYWERYDIPKNSYVYGLRILEDAYLKCGEHLFTNMVHIDNAIARQNKELNYLKDIFFTNSWVFMNGLALIFFIIFFPLFLVKALCKSIVNNIFSSIPYTLDYNNTDLYLPFFRRFFTSKKESPTVIVNPHLDQTLANLIKENKTITNYNKQLYWWSTKKKNYNNLIIYGKPGTGKTLFAKQLSKKSGMKFIYLDYAIFSEWDDEERAMKTIKSLLKDAKSNDACILIIDEADKFFSDQDSKIQKMAKLLEAYFSEKIETRIQIVLITNDPVKIPESILNKIFHKIEFDKPLFNTQKYLFHYHLSLLERNDLNLEALVDSLKEKDLQGLVGQEIKLIIEHFNMLDTVKTPYPLQKVIQEFQDKKEKISNFN